ncbi:MAG: polysaccharide biosynthesis C-terminal domain-containing protein [Clostridia bacterium]|nr:polysaccharide biosynthesis C-terminal domain-containing protein [Clostridia bacterium]
MAKSNSRLKNSIRNSAFGLFAEVTTLILGFFVRSVFVKTLAEDYLGVNGLFTNILQVLSFAELGIGNAIVFSLYKPIREKDRERIRQYVAFYKYAYRIIGAVVAVLGLLLVPFLNVIIVDKPDIPDNLIIIYLLYLANTVFSYFCVWKRTFMTANQERYIGTVVEQIFTIIQVVVQIVLLYTTHNFILYLATMIVSNQVRNVIIARICSKRYPIVNEKPREDLTKEEKKSIFENVKALFVYKLSGVVLGSTDNILIQAIINFRSVSLYSNYSMIITNFRLLANQLLNGITASVGDLNASDDNKAKEDVFFKLLFVSFWLYSFLCVGFVSTADSLISAWLGYKFTLPIGTVMAIAFSFYVEGMQFAGFTYRTTMGLFKESVAAPVLSAVINIVLSIILGYKMGMSGIFIATGISRLVTTTWVDGYLVFKRRLNKSPLKFFVTYVLYFLFAAVMTIILQTFLSLFDFEGWMGFLKAVVITAVVYNVLFVLVFGATTKVFYDVLNMFLKRGKKV